MELMNNIKSNVLNASFYAECSTNGISNKKCEEIIKNFAYGIVRAFLNEYCYCDIYCVYNTRIFNKTYIKFIEKIQISYNLYKKEINNIEYIQDCKDEVSQLIQIYILNYKNMSYFYDLLFCILARSGDQDQCNLPLIFKNVIENEYLI
jgi:hypothetical protein